jgi:hypothetical protein
MSRHERTAARCTHTTAGTLRRCRESSATGEANAAANQCIARHTSGNAGGEQRSSEKANKQRKPTKTRSRKFSYGPVPYAAGAHDRPKYYRTHYVRWSRPARHPSAFPRRARSVRAARSTSAPAWRKCILPGIGRRKLAACASRESSNDCSVVREADSKNSQGAWARC